MSTHRNVFFFILYYFAIFLDVAVADAKIINDRGTQLYKEKK